MSSLIKVLILIFIYINLTYSEKCTKSDLAYKYTECDKSGRRWLVSVPNNTKSCDKDSDFIIPRKARDCGNPCDPGTYLHIETQECSDCLPGTYSQSATIEIDHWQRIPPGFNSFSIGYDDRDCNSENWVAKGDYIAAGVSRCETHLYYTASLYREGALFFEYQNPEDDLIFAIKISNENCKKVSTNKDSSDVVRYLDPTGPSSWKKAKFDLKLGNNIIRWMVVGPETHRSTVKIRYIKISNSIFSSECIPCNPGYFSSARSSKCTPCAMNTYSNTPGSSQCLNCPTDKYSFPGSKSCTDRLACQSVDYTYRWTLCDKQHQRKKIYYWIEPKLCSEVQTGSVNLPVVSNSEPCTLCPAGTFMNENSGECQFCPASTASLKSGDTCTKCGPNTKPITEINYNQWSHPLPNLSFRCLKINNECNSNETWLYNGDHLQSSPAFDINLLQFDFEIISERNTSDQISRSQFSFDFSMKCSGYCVLHLFLKTLSSKKHLTIQINRWVNSTNRETFNYNLFRENKGNFVWFFSRSKDYETSVKSDDYIRIYSIKMTKLKNVGAVRCQACNQNSSNTECADCEKGKYFSLKTQNCVQCPAGFILTGNPGRSIDDCFRCGEGLIAYNGSSCLPNIHYQSLHNNHYYLNNLKGSHIELGNNLFTAHGQQYKHLFNVTLFSDSNTFSTCRNNVTALESSNDSEFILSETFYDESGPMCRLTLISSKLENGSTYSMQSIYLADKFTKIQQSNSSLEYWNSMNKSLSDIGFTGDKSGMDLHVYLKSDRTTENCKNGYGTIVTLRCDKAATKNQLVLPPKCPTETCDGCNFHFLLISRDACPQCRLEDYSVLTEECYNGHQTRHFTAPNFCVEKPGFQNKIPIKCPLFTTKMEIGIIVTAGVLSFLLGLVVYCYKKNKKLEYKYMRLIGGNDDNENVLNGVESCGMHDDEEEDEDDVKIKTNSKSGKVFAKYNKPSHYRNDRNSMERINLSENPDFDI